MSLGKSKMLSQGGAGAVVNTDNFDIVTYTGNGSTYDVGNGVDASVTLNSGSANYALGSTSYGNNSGKKYFEVEYKTAGSSGTPTLMVGIINTAYQESWTNANTKMYYANNGNKYTGGSGSSYGATFTEGDIIGVAYDGTARTVTFYKNNVSQGTAFTGLITNYPSYKPAIGTGLNSETAQFRFTTANFTYTPPTGYSEWGASTVSAHSGTIQSASPAHPINFQPDLVWIKDRDNLDNHNLADSVRGAQKFIFSNLTSQEFTSANYLTSFNSDGFSLGSDNTSNRINTDFVAWCWKAGGAAVSNTDGTITSQVSANQAAGFSAVKYTGENAARTVGHGLSSTPEMVIIKNLNDSRNWMVWHKDLSASSYLHLNLSSQEDTDTRTNGGQPRPFGPFTSNTFGVNIDNETGYTNDYIAYCFHSVSGYQSVGSYTGTGTSGNSITTGFRPRFLIVKAAIRPSGGGSWYIFDSVRTTSNPQGQYLQANESAQELDGTSVFNIDFENNGFTVNGTNNEINQSGSTYIYLAIA